ncbi:MAG: hypothetical protein GXY55_02075 [Phycisphaerae bacterium]|nr:hypothetical protein [Phycisphaerae bacterium]
MMKPQVLRGSKQTIAETVAGLAGEVREAIVFVEEPTAHTGVTGSEDVFIEMEPFTVHAGDVDYSREGLYSRAEDE